METNVVRILTYHHPVLDTDSLALKDLPAYCFGAALAYERGLKKHHENSSVKDKSCILFTGLLHQRVVTSFRQYPSMYDRGWKDHTVQMRA